MERVSGPTPAIPGHALAGEQIAKHVAHISEFGYTVVDNVRASSHTSLAHPDCVCPVPTEPQSVPSALPGTAPAPAAAQHQQH